jgi:hypothetical protein
MAEQTLVSEGGAAVDYCGAERRRAPRFQCLRVISCVLRQTDQRLWGRVRDISTGGMGLVTGSKVEPGTHLVLELKSAAFLPTLALPARVAHATPRASGSWLIGCQFDQPLSQEQVQSLL